MISSKDARAITKRFLEGLACPHVLQSIYEDKEADCNGCQQDKLGAVLFERCWIRFMKEATQDE